MMQIKVQLFSNLRDCLPAGAKHGQATICLPNRATLADLITHPGIDRRLGTDATEIEQKAV
jgi:hypothetical protein